MNTQALRGLEKPNRERIHELLTYDPVSGDFTRLVTLAGNARKGMRAGCKNAIGYIRIGLDRKTYPAHVLAFVCMTGEWPLEEIDHINGDRADNRWSNLRKASRSQNSRNTTMLPNNTSGYKGVAWHKSANKWVSRISRSDGTAKHLGCFTDPVAAARAYDIAAIHEHGEFARTNEMMGLI